MLSVLRHLNYKAWFAIAEFIDNALQSYLANRVALETIHGSDFRLEVDVRIETNGPGLIVITDNAAGHFRRRFSTGIPGRSSARRPDGVVRVRHGHEKRGLLVR